MTGLKIRLADNFSDTTLPVLRDDPMLGPGALFLFDPSHSQKPMAAGVPLNNAVIPNLAWAQAAAAIGSGTEATLAGTYSRSSSFGNDTKGRVERTPKGGIHVIPRQATALVIGDFAMITLPAAVQAYLYTNRAHNFYMSTWDRFTRLNIGGASTAEIGNGQTTANTGMAFILTSGNAMTSVVGPPASPFIDLGRTTRGSGWAALGNALKAVGGSSPTPTAASWPYCQAYWGVPLGGSYNKSVSRYSGAPAYVLYRWCVEDLTVSGRTFAQAEAADFAAWTAAFATGGRYTGDTIPTDPATLP